MSKVENDGTVVLQKCLRLHKFSCPTLEWKSDLSSFIGEKQEHRLASDWFLNQELQPVSPTQMPHHKHVHSPSEFDWAYPVKTNVLIPAKSFAFSKSTIFDEKTFCQFNTLESHGWLWCPPGGSTTVPCFALRVLLHLTCHNLMEYK